MTKEFDGLSSENMIFSSEIDLYRQHNNELIKTVEQLQLEVFQLNQQLSELESENLHSETYVVKTETRLEFYSGLFENYPTGLAILNDKGRVIESNLIFRNLLDLPDHPPRDKYFSSFLDKNTSLSFKKHLMSLTHEKPQKGIINLKNGTFLGYHLIRPRIADMTENSLLIIHEFSFDSINGHLFRLAKFAIEQMKEGLMITDHEHNIIFVNQSFSEITGYKFEEAVGESPSLLASGRHAPSFYTNMYDELASKGWWAGEIWNKRKNGEIYPEFIQITRAYDEITNAVFYIASFSDITARKAYQQHLDRLAFFDSLTSLPNRASLENHVENIISRIKPRLDSIFAFLFLDLDKFKAVNDTYGHPEGDMVLREAAQRIIATIRNDDFAARIGGDEFVIILTRITSKKDVITIVEKLIHQMTQPFIGSAASHHLSTSIGISFFPENGLHMDDLMRRADAAMYNAKQQGRNRYSVFDSSLESIAEEEVKIITLLKDAILGKNNSLQMHYQPLFKANNTDEPCAYECLVRMQDAEGHFISPDFFITLAEDNHLIADLGMKIFDCICQDIALNKPSEHIDFEVNLSPLQFLNPNLLEELQQTAENHDIDFKRFNFEITETATIENLSIMIDCLHEMRNQGCDLLLDDFGTGYASLSMLKELPTNIIKIDRSFITDLSESDETQKLVKALIAMAKSLNLKIVAEGVETGHQFEWLRNYGVDLFQGYWLGKPAPLKEYSQ